MDAIRGELEYETAKRKWKRLVSVIGGKGGRLWRHGNPSLLLFWPMWPTDWQKDLRVQADCLLPGIGLGYKEWTCHWLLLVNKPNTVGKMRCEAEDAAVSMPCLSLSLPLLVSLINPPTFSSSVSEKSNTTPFLRWCPEPLNFLKTVCHFICLPRVHGHRPTYGHKRAQSLAASCCHTCCGY